MPGLASQSPSTHLKNVSCLVVIHYFHSVPLKRVFVTCQALLLSPQTPRAAVRETSCGDTENVPKISMQSRIYLTSAGTICHFGKRLR